MQSISGSKLNWYVLYTYSNSEKIAHRELMRLGMESFLPLRTEYRTWHDRRKKIEVPLFKNYLFIRSTERERNRVFGVRQVHHFISQNGRPNIVKEEEIAVVKMLLKGTYAYEVVGKGNVGSQVTIIEGAFAGWEGLFLSTKGQHKVIIELKTMNRVVSLEVPQEWVLLSKRINEIAAGGHSKQSCGVQDNRHLL